MKGHRSLAFKWFLVVYGGFLSVHVWEMGIDSWQLLAALLGGLAIAFVAHKGHGYLPTVFLVGHMFIEWYHHALHSNHYDPGEIAFHGTHAVLDMVFLYVEAQEHYAKYALSFIGLVVLAIASIFAYNYVPAPYVVSYVFTPVHHSHGGGVLHYVVIGGMLGCILSHLFLSIRKKHAH